MDPRLPPLDLVLVNNWVNEIVDVAWPLVAVLAGVVIGAAIVRAFRRALSGTGD